MSKRPELTPDIASEAFAEHYWLRHELAGFCRANNLRTDGNKQQLAARITALLTGTIQPPVQRLPSRRSMPTEFTRETPIAPGWRCSEALRAFFSAEIGRPFRFDGFMREQIRAGKGTPLGTVLDAWSQQQGRRHEIAPQFEYNRFTRDYRIHAPKATHQEVVAAWQRYRAMPSTRRPSVERMARGTAKSAADLTMVWKAS